ncbi:efflux RND transporter periplasmic adaptor subunit [Candidatus Nitrospira salsa]|nr:MAG: hemolysin D [Nitrospirales bacterium]
MPPTPSSKNQRLQLGLKIIVPFVVLALAGSFAFSLVKNTPHPQRQPKSKQARLVNAIEISVTTHPVMIEAWGEVQPARQVTLRPQVSGEIMSVSPELVPGGKFSKGDTILRLHPADYILALRQRETDLDKARAEFLLEEGNQVVAKQEFELLGESITEQEKSMVLRLPQLQSAKANVNAAKAAVASAKLAISRTVLRVPFDSTVLQRHVNTGSYITPTSDIVTLVGTREYWVTLSVPIAQLRWIHFPRTWGENGSSVKLYHDTIWGKTAFRTGQVIRLLTDLETEGRMARVLVAINDPLNLHTQIPGGPEVILGTYLRAEIQGQDMAQVAKVDRDWIHDHDTVWVLNNENTLEIRTVTIVYRGPSYVLISSGLQHGERLIVTDIPAPVEGMPLRLLPPPPVQKEATHAT